MKDDFLSDVICSLVLNWIWVSETLPSKLNRFLRRTTQTELVISFISRHRVTCRQWKSNDNTTATERWWRGSKVIERTLSSPLTQTQTSTRTNTYFLIGAAAWGAVEAVILLWLLSAVLRPRSLSTALMTAIKSAAIKIDLKRKKENGDILQNNYTHERLNATAVTLRELWHIFTLDAPLWQSTQIFKAFVIAFICLHVPRSLWFSCFSDTKFARCLLLWCV